MSIKTEADKIYLDMDGVLADFSKGVLELCGIAAEEKQDENPERDDMMWEQIKKIDHFYSKLDLMPGAREMFDSLYGRFGERCEILTGIPKARRGILYAAEDKTEWVKRLLSDTVVVNTVYKAEKKNFVKGNGSILIDDLEQNIREWREAGGTGILFKSAAQAMSELEELNII